MRSTFHVCGSPILQYFLHFRVARSLPHRVCAIGKGLAQAEAEDFLCTGLWISSSAIRRAYVRDVSAIRQQNQEGLAFALHLTLRRAVMRFTGVLPSSRSCAYTAFAIAPHPLCPRAASSVPLPTSAPPSTHWRTRLPPSYPPHASFSAHKSAPEPLAAVPARLVRPYPIRSRPLMRSSPSSARAAPPSAYRPRA